MDAVKYAMSLCDVSQREPPPRAAPPEKEKGRLGLMVSSVVRKGKTGLRRGIAEVAQNFHKLVTLSGGRASPLARIVNALMEQRGSTIENGCVEKPKIQIHNLHHSVYSKKGRQSKGRSARGN